MPEHTLKPGQTLIDGLVALGRCLGYHVESESPVRKNGRNPPAVDVAWMADQLQEFPLMIFEVESVAGNTIANNPTKVFGQSTNQFEKPLFFFHAILKSGTQTRRIDDLQSLFGLHNYRLYRLDHDEKTKLIKDVLTQHRRIKRELDLPNLKTLLNHEAWIDVDPDVIFDHVEQTQFDCPYLNIYANLAVSDAKFLERFVKRLVKQEVEPLHQKHTYGYSTFIGQHARSPIHLAILTRTLPEKADEFLDRLKTWQEKAPMMPQIAPNFGLSRDYDEFLLGTAPGLLASVAAIYGRHQKGRAYLTSLLKAVFSKIARVEPRLSFYSAVWLLHMSASLPNGSVFEEARIFINERGGIKPHCLLSPPFQMPVTEDYPTEMFPWGSEIQNQPEMVPSSQEFLNRVKQANPKRFTESDALVFATRLLTEQGDLEYLAPQAVALLAIPL